MVNSITYIIRIKLAILFHLHVKFNMTTKIPSRSKNSYQTLNVTFPETNFSVHCTFTIELAKQFFHHVLQKVFCASYFIRIFNIVFFDKALAPSLLLMSSCIFQVQGHKSSALTQHPIDDRKALVHLKTEHELCTRIYLVWEKVCHTKLPLLYRTTSTSNLGTMGLWSIRFYVCDICDIIKVSTIDNIHIKCSCIWDSNLNPILQSCFKMFQSWNLKVIMVTIKQFKNVTLC